MQNSLFVLYTGCQVLGIKYIINTTNRIAVNFSIQISSYPLSTSIIENTKM